jgi:hypothetical protein
VINVLCPGRTECGEAFWTVDAVRVAEGGQGLEVIDDASTKEALTAFAHGASDLFRQA